MARRSWRCMRDALLARSLALPPAFLGRENPRTAIQIARFPKEARPGRCSAGRQPHLPGARSHQLSDAIYVQRASHLRIRHPLTRSHPPLELTHALTQTHSLSSPTAHRPRPQLQHPSKDMPAVAAAVETVRHRVHARRFFCMGSCPDVSWAMARCAGRPAQGTVSLGNPRPAGLLLPCVSDLAL